MEDEPHQLKGRFISILSSSWGFKSDGSKAVFTCGSNSFTFTRLFTFKKNYFEKSKRVFLEIWKRTNLIILTGFFPLEQAFLGKILNEQEPTNFASASILWLYFIKDFRQINCFSVLFIIFCIHFVKKNNVADIWWVYIWIKIILYSVKGNFYGNIFENLKSFIFLFAFLKVRGAS